MSRLKLFMAIFVACLTVSSAGAQITNEPEQPVIFPASGSHGTELSKLTILFVGENPDNEINIPEYITGLDAERLPELTTERMGAFKAFLPMHFASVKFLNAEDYEVVMSDDFDVTIFDAMPPPIDEVDEGSWTRKLRMPLDFDRPALLVGEVAPVMLGRLGIGLRLDHL